MSVAETGPPRFPTSGSESVRWVPFADARETHSAAVFLFGDRGYKVKKPVNLGFLDFSDRDRRLAVCRRELELNRRIAPDVYLGVAELSVPGGGPAEPVLVMRRMPDDRRLSRLALGSEELDDDLRRLAHLLAGFHGRAHSDARIAQAGTRDALASRWDASFGQVRPFHDTVLHDIATLEIEALTRDYLAGREPLFDARIRAGAVVDGHGDLTADDIFLLEDGARVLDCLEFDDALRYVDRIDDAAFLAMDLERLGRPELARRFLDWYDELSGDHPPPSLVHHYLAYRAFVRVKVACLQHEQGSPAAAGTARLLAGITLDHLRAGTVRMVLVGGEPGTGKTTLTGQLADRLGMTRISSDRIRKELSGVSAETSLAGPIGEGAYSSGSTARTYAEVLRRAETLLANGESVVLDATWSAAEHRALARAVAERTHSRLTELRCRLAADQADARIAARIGESDADAAVAAAIRARFAPWPEAVEVDTAGHGDGPADLAERVVTE